MSTQAMKCPHCPATWVVPIVAEEGYLRGPLREAAASMVLHLEDVHQDIARAKRLRMWALTNTPGVEGRRIV